MQFLNSIRNKLLLGYAIVTLPALVGLGWYGGGQIETALRTQGLRRLETRIQALSDEVTAYLAGTDGDLLLLADSAPLVQYLLAVDSRDPKLVNAAERNLAQSFVRLSEVRQRYHQVRYIDGAGMEKIRVDHDGERAHVVRAADMQNKRDRFYFTQAMELGEGAVLVSPIDLNRERGEIEEPHRPVVRYATPVFDARDKRRGILVINVAVQPILDKVAGVSSGGEEMFLTDAGGFYLAHPDRAKLWGGENDLGHDANVARDHPEIGRKVLAATGLFIDEGDDVVTLSTPIAVPGARDGRLGVLVDLMPTDVLYATASDFRTMFNVLTVVALVIVLALGTVVAQYVTRPIAALTAAVDRMSRGDLDEPISVDSNDETHTLALAMERLRKSMKVMLDKYS